MYIFCTACDSTFFLWQFKSSQPQTSTETVIELEDVAATTVPEDITDYYDKMDKADEDDDEEASLKTVSFEVNQVCILLI